MARQLSDSNQKKLTDKARQLIADERAMRGSVWLHTGGYLWNASAIIEGVLSVINGILLIAMLIGLLLTVTDGGVKGTDKYASLIYDTRLTVILIVLLITGFIFHRLKKHVVASALFIAEAAVLIALPQAPEARRPDLLPAAALAARGRVLQRAVAAGALPGTAIAELGSKPLGAARRPLPMSAPHAAEIARRRMPDQAVVTTMIDAPLQAGIERLALTFPDHASDRISIAAIVIRNDDLAVRAYLGGADYFSETRAGQVDLVAAVRSPGSALKPFIYGMAFEKLIAHPFTVVVDQPKHFGTFEPRNFLRIIRARSPCAMLSSAR